MKSNKRLIAIIGNRNSGKSTIIRALTGCKGSALPVIIKDESTGKWITVISQSPEERPISIAELRKRFRSASNNRRSLGLVIALQPNNPTKRLSIEDVFEIAEDYPFARYAFAIAEPYKNASLPVDPEDIAVRLRKFHIKRPIQPVDARRFAHVNASAIRDIVGWF